MADSHKHIFGEPKPTAVACIAQARSGRAVGLTKRPFSSHDAHPPGERTPSKPLCLCGLRGLRGLRGMLGRISCAAPSVVTGGPSTQINAQSIACISLWPLLLASISQRLFFLSCSCRPRHTPRQFAVVNKSSASFSQAFNTLPVLLQWLVVACCNWLLEFCASCYAAWPYRSQCLGPCHRQHR